MISINVPVPIDMRRVKRTAPIAHAPAAVEVFHCVRYGWLRRAACGLRFRRARRRLTTEMHRGSLSLRADLDHCERCSVGRMHAQREEPAVQLRVIEVGA